MKRLRLVALIWGDKKNGTKWYKATFKNKNKDGKLVIKEYWLTPEVGSAALNAGLEEDVDVYVECELDDFLNPSISKIMPTTKAGVNG